MGFLIITAITGVIGIVSLYQFVTIIDSLKTTVPESIEDFKTKASILESDRLIIYYDEVLTQSARNYAFTHDEMWKLRYFQTEPVLDKLINEPYGNANNSVFLELNKINIELVNMEKEAIRLTDNGEYQQAISILESDEYTIQKSLYTDSLKIHAENNNLEYDDGIKSLENTSLLLSSNIDRVTKEGTIVLEIIFPILVSLSIFLGIFFSKRLATPINDLKKSVKQIASGNFNVNIAVRGPDEIQELIQDFKTMVVELNKIDVMKRDFSAMITHELKTPLVPIIGYVDLLLSQHFGDLNQNQTERLLRIKNNCLRMQK
ncbi:MAG: HAMP domain-containing protein [Nanoarchaeota archaeon]|nr:HAMP domain-containing protein [Nanoarchaeota archaeon]